jgi:hypothetical protein
MSSQRVTTRFCLTCPLLFCDERHKECPRRLHQYAAELDWRRRNREKIAEYNRRAKAKRMQVN